MATRMATRREKALVSVLIALRRVWNTYPPDDPKEALTDDDKSYDAGYKEGFEFALGITEKAITSWATHTKVLK